MSYITLCNQVLNINVFGMHPLLNQFEMSIIQLNKLIFTLFSHFKVRVYNFSADFKYLPAGTRTCNK